MFSCLFWHVLKREDVLICRKHRTSNTFPPSSIPNKSLWKEDRKSMKLCVCVCSYLYDEALVVAAAALWYQLIFEAAAFLIQLHHRVFTSRCQNRTGSSGLQTDGERRESQALHLLDIPKRTQVLMFPQSKTRFPLSPVTWIYPSVCRTTGRENNAEYSLTIRPNVINWQYSQKSISQLFYLHNNSMKYYLSIILNYFQV